MKQSHANRERHSGHAAAALRRLDLNLFRVFAAVMQHRSVAAASRELGVTPSAVSHALGRLRRGFGDELFVLGEAGMEPTPCALELAPDIGDAMARLDAALNRQPFEPVRSQRTFRLAATDYSDTAFVPLLVERILGTAPQVKLRVFPANRIDVIAALEERRIDLALGWFGTAGASIRRRTIATDTDTLVARPGHPLAGAPVSLGRVLQFPQLVVELTGGDGLAGGFLNERGVYRRTWIEQVVIQRQDGRHGADRVAVTVPHYAAVIPMLQRTDLIATLPGRLAAAAIAQGALAEIDAGHTKIVVDIEAIWHRRADRDTGVQWLITELCAAMQA